MKVICVNASLDPHEFPYKDFRLVEGEIYTVLREKFGFDVNDLPVKCYQLAEDEKDLYRVSKFIPLSTIDETEVAKTRETPATVAIK